LPHPRDDVIEAVEKLDGRSAAPDVWRLLYTRPRQEARVLANLDRLEVRYCAPRVELPSARSGQRPQTREWLFPRYVFVKVDFDHTPLNYLKFMAGVAGFVRIGQTLAQVSEDVVKSLSDSVMRLEATLAKPRFVRGERVQLATGSFSGLDGVFLEPDGEARSCLLLRWLGRELEVSVENQHVAAIA
jgi:transcriptional antiterminator RfaH